MVCSACECPPRGGLTLAKAVTRSQSRDLPPGLFWASPLLYRRALVRRGKGGGRTGRVQSEGVRPSRESLHQSPPTLRCGRMCRESHGTCSQRTTFQPLRIQVRGGGVRGSGDEWEGLNEGTPGDGGVHFVRATMHPTQSWRGGGKGGDEFARNSHPSPLPTLF